MDISEVLFENGLYKVTCGSHCIGYFRDDKEAWVIADSVTLHTAYHQHQLKTVDCNNDGQANSQGCHSSRENGTGKNHEDVSKPLDETQNKGGMPEGDDERGLDKNSMMLSSWEQFISSNSRLKAALNFSYEDSYSMQQPENDFLVRCSRKALLSAAQERAVVPCDGAPVCPKISYPGPSIKANSFSSHIQKLDPTIKYEDENETNADMEALYDRSVLNPRWWKAVHPKTSELLAMGVTVSHEEAMKKRIYLPKDWYYTMFGFKCKEVNLRLDAALTAQCTKSEINYTEGVILQVNQSHRSDGEYFWDFAYLFDKINLYPGDFISFLKENPRLIALGNPPGVWVSMERLSTSPVTEQILARTYLDARIRNTNYNFFIDTQCTSKNKYSSSRKRKTQTKTNPYGADYVGGEIFDDSHYVGEYLDEYDSDDYGGIEKVKRMKLNSSKNNLEKRTFREGVCSAFPTEAWPGRPPRMSLGICSVREPGQRMPAHIVEKLKYLDCYQFETMLTNFYIGLKGRFKVPSMGKQKLDLHRVFLTVAEHGGYEMATANKQWKAICRCTGLHVSGQTAPSTAMRTNYERCLLDFENYICSGQFEIDEAAGRLPSHMYLTSRANTRFHIPPPNSKISSPDGCRVCTNPTSNILESQISDVPSFELPYSAHARQSSSLVMGACKSLSPYLGEAKMQNGSCLASACPETRSKNYGHRILEASEEMSAKVLIKQEETEEKPLVSSRNFHLSTESLGASLDIFHGSIGTEEKEQAAEFGMNPQPIANAESIVGTGRFIDVRINSSITHKQNMTLQVLEKSLLEAEKELTENQRPWRDLEELKSAIKCNAMWIAELESGLEEARAYHRTLLCRHTKAEEDANRFGEPPRELLDRIKKLKHDILRHQKGCNISE